MAAGDHPSQEVAHQHVDLSCSNESAGDHPSQVVAR